jgi:hypothetical protein
VVLHSAGGLQDWVAERIGPLDGGLQPYQLLPETPRDARFARQKFHARSASKSWLVKFAGLGRIGEQKMRDAQALARAGFGAKTCGLSYGYLIQDWLTGTPPGTAWYDRGKFITRLGDYLAFRANCLGKPGPGASLDELRHMTIANSSEALGAAAAQEIETRLARLEASTDRAKRIRTDNRLHAWEWLDTKAGILKLDAVDHCCGHDLVGCQDIAWDVAGATAEHDLGDDEIDVLTRSLRRRGVAVDPELTAALLPCYLAFQLGLWSTATGGQRENAGMIESYARKLSCVLHQDSDTRNSRR